MVLDVLGSIIGGGGGNRTRVRKSSAFCSTCLGRSFSFTFVSPIVRINKRDFLKFHLQARKEQED